VCQVSSIVAWSSRVGDLGCRCSRLLRDAEEARILARLDLAHLVDGRRDGGCYERRLLALLTAQLHRLRGGLVSDFALRAVGRVLEGAADLAEVEGRDVAVALVVPLGCAAPAAELTGTGC
jgi:hypothetical protein